MMIVSEKEDILGIFKLLLVLFSFTLIILAFLNLYKSHSVHYLSFESQIDELDFQEIFVKFKNKPSKFTGKSHLNSKLNNACLFRIPYLDAKIIEIHVPKSLFVFNDLNFTVYSPDFTVFCEVKTDDISVEKSKCNDFFIINISLSKDLTFHRPFVFLLKSFGLFIFSILNFYFVYFIISRLCDGKT